MILGTRTFFLSDNQSQVTEGWSGLVLTEVNQHLAITLPHILRHSEDTGHVVVEEGVLLLCVGGETVIAHRFTV